MFFNRKKKKRKKKEPMNTSTKIILALGIFACIFITIMIITFWVKDSVPDTLIQYVLGAGGVEALLCAGIKISKVITKQDTKDEPQDFEEAEGEFIER